MNEQGYSRTKFCDHVESLVGRRWRWKWRHQSEKKCFVRVYFYTLFFHDVMNTFTFLKTCVVSFWRLQLDRRCCTTWIDWGRLSFFGWHRGRIAPIPKVTCIELFSVEVWWMGPFSVEVSGPWRVVWLDRPFSCWQVV